LLGIVVLAAASIASGLIGLVGGEPAGAVISTVGGTCGFHLGAPLVTGSAGTAGLEFLVYPANPSQVCQVRVTAQASLSPISGGSYTNVIHDPSSNTFTLDFTGGPLPLGILWQWSPRCADPVTAGIFTLAVDGQSSSSGPLSAPSCFPDLGGSSSLAFDFIDPADAYVAVGMAATTDGHGYWGVYASGADVVAKGDAVTAGLLPPLNQPVVGVTADPTGQGYWIDTADGGVFSFGGAAFRGSLGGVHLNAPVVGMAATPDGRGYWLVASDGGVFSFGDAAFRGSLGGVHLNAPVVGMAATPDGRGYWLAAYDGGVFSFGDAPFEGSAADLFLAAPVFAMAPTPSGHGYWLLGGDGGIFAFGDAGFFGSVPLAG
jgi:hypothetical protein